MYCDSQVVDPSKNSYDANIHLFRLAHILGDIMDDAVSLKPVSYDSVLANDRLLQEWWETLPTELDMDGYTLVNFLASPMTSKRCMGVQSIVVRAAFLHVRFAMHRPYASFARSERSKYAKSLEVSFNAAEKLIALTAHARPETHNHKAVSMHMSWCQMHSFSAAMFFCFQIINKPQQAGAGRLRNHVLHAIRTLESFSGVRVVEKALDILRTLSPLYAEEFLSDTLEDRERKKQTVLLAVRKLQFPCIDSDTLNAPIGAANAAGSANDAFSPTQSSAYTDSPQPTGPGPDPVWGTTTVHPQSQVPPATMSQPHQQHLLHQQHQQEPQHPTYEDLPSLKWSHTDLVVGDPALYPGQRQQGHPSATRHEPQQYRDTLPRQLADEAAMWRSAAAVAAHQSPTATMVASEPSGAGTVASPSRAEFYTQQQMMGQQQQAQDVYSQQAGGEDDFGGGYGAMDSPANMGLRIVAESVLWGASGFVQGEWDRMYTELGCQTRT
jgi:hypothetical protein